MKADELEAKMRKLESYHTLRVPDGAYPILRIDGRSFTKLTENFQHPFDYRLHELLIETVKAVVENFSALYGYTESDEVSILLPREFDLFDRSVEKLVSLSASLAASAFTLTESAMILSGELEAGTIGHVFPHFDARLIVATTVDQVVDYFRWRQGDSQRCCLNGYSYWKLREKGASKRQATRQLAGQKAAFKHELMHEHGVNFAHLPGWQKDGTGFWWEQVAHIGRNPLTDERVDTTRNQLRLCENLPTGDEYGQLIRRIAMGIKIPEGVLIWSGM